MPTAPRLEAKIWHFPKMSGISHVMLLNKSEEVTSYMTAIGSSFYSIR
jgi:hypothetical protein